MRLLAWQSLPSRGVIDVYGEEGSGKSSAVCYHLQDDDVCWFSVDTHPQFLPSHFVLAQTPYVEDLCQILTELPRQMKIVVDSAQMLLSERTTSLFFTLQCALDTLVQSERQCWWISPKRYTQNRAFPPTLGTALLDQCASERIRVQRFVGRLDFTFQVHSSTFTSCAFPFAWEMDWLLSQRQQGTLVVRGSTFLWNHRQIGRSKEESLRWIRENITPWFEPRTEMERR